MPPKSDVEHWYINATVYKDRVEEIHYITDPARNIRRRRQTRVWQVERSLGRGGFGEVRLEKNKEDEKARAVKRIATTSTALSNSECEKELKALLEFSKPKSRSVYAVAFSPDGKLVASASHDRTVRLWDSTTEAAGKYALAS